MIHFGVVYIAKNGFSACFFHFLAKHKNGCFFVIRAGHSERPSRRDREFLSLGLVIRDENEIFFHQSRASRRDREFLPLSLMIRDEIENFFL